MKSILRNTSRLLEHLQFNMHSEEGGETDANRW